MAIATAMAMAMVMAMAKCKQWQDIARGETVSKNTSEEVHKGSQTEAHNRVGSGTAVASRSIQIRGEWAAVAYLLDEARCGDFICRLK